ncbi:MAG TPA: hypothetical protein VN698_04495, partial [Bacteroidia bacterium]|nr:hypothetical protein [Bacteroidia bacterium]
MKKFLFLSLNILIGTSIFAQQGKDGPGNISTANTVVNNVSTTLTSNAAAGTSTIAVASTVGLAAGDLLFIMQAQGANVYAYTYQFGNPNDALPNDTSSGKVKAYNGAGNNEFAEINSIAGNVITLNCTLSDSFRGSATAGDIKSQIVRVPRYTTLALSGAGSITCNTWNGSTGGVVVIEVQGNTTLAAGTSINATAKGFRGGSPIWATGFGSTSTGHNYGNSGANNGGHKGESIVGDTSQYNKGNLNTSASNYNTGTAEWLSMPLTICKANVANGGGGGDANNCGGGGGSNGGSIALWNGMGNPDPAYATSWSKETSATNTNGTLPPTSSSGGGRGGYAYSASSGASADPTVTGPNNSGTWGGDSRHNDGGWGGTPLDYSTGKIFLGGGGGAGDGNDGHASPGGTGGGIIYLVSYGTVTGAGTTTQFIADGGTTLATSSFGPNSNGDDGAGGGGGGGAIIIKSVGTISLTAATPISAQGGKGGDNNYGGITVTKHCFGPGGGGGGGYVATTNAVTGINVNGGANGAVTGANNTSTIKTKFPPNGATIGGSGSTTTSVAPFYLTSTNYTVCPSSAVSLSVTVNGTAPGGLAVSWYTVATGGTAVSNSNPYGITAAAVAGTYTYYAGTCPGTYRLPVLVTVNSTTPPTLTVSATNTAVCSGTTVTLTVSGATSYTWDANAGNATTNTVAVTPLGNTTYTVTGATTGACAGTNTASININVTTPPSITITPTSYTLCSGINDTLKASAGSALSYTWSSNASSATTSSVIVSPPVGATTYSVIGSDGVCSSTQSVTITVTAAPSLSVSPTNTYICKGTNTTFTASGATTYSWSTTATTNTISVSPTSNTTYTVIGNNGACSDTKTVLVKVDNGITKADSISNAASCGQANGSYVLNSVTGGISPYQINFNGTGFSTIPAFTYSVGSLIGNTYPIILKDSLGCTYSTSVTIGNTSGITKIDSVIANANCVPTNSGTITINSITGGAAPYQASINGGSFNPIASFPYSFPNLIAGTYTIQVKDGSGCPHISFITVGSNGGPTSVATSTIQPDTCGKSVGTIAVGTVTGGATPYQYSIDGITYQASTTFTGLASGGYTVSIKDNNGCSITSTNTVSSVSGPTSVSVTT